MKTNSRIPSRIFAALLVVVSTIALSAQAQTAPNGGGKNAPSMVIPPARGPVAYRKLSDVKSLRIMQYNVENMFLAPSKNNDGSTQPPKSMPALQGVARAILDVNPDIIVVEEVDTIQTLALFSERLLGPGRYRVGLIEGNDQRGIDIGFLIKSDLPLVLNLQSNRNITWRDPANGNQVEPLFSRDLPMLYVRRSDRETVPALIVVGNHGKAMTDRANDPQSRVLRTAQYQMAAQLINQQMHRWPGVPMVLLGDFNTEVRNSKEILPFRALMADVFDITKMPPQARVTETFHPRNLPTVYNQLDDIYVSPSLVKSVESATIYRYKDPQGHELPIPRTFEERERNPSDHFPVYIDVSTQNIFPEAHQGLAHALGF